MVSLTKEEKEQIETVIRISESVLESYRLLMELEIKGKLNTKEYSQVLERLLVSINLENNLVSKLYNEFYNINNLIKYIKERLEIKYSEVEALTKISVEALPYRRLANLIVREFNKNKRPENIAVNEITNMLFGNRATDLTTMLTLIDMDTFNFVLRTLEEKINSPFYKDIRENLIKTKYNFLYITEGIANLLSSDNKKIIISNEVYFYGMTLAKKLNIDSDLYLKVRKEYGINLVTEQLHEILSAKDYEYKIIENRTTLELREIFLRLALQLISPDEVTTSNEAFHTIIERDNLEDTISAELIANAYRSYRKDQSSIRTLTLKG